MVAISVRTAWHVFVVSILLVAAVAYIGDRSASRYEESEAWVSHTRDVESHIADLRADMAVASSARSLRGVDSTALSRYQAAAAQIEPELDQLRRLTADNAAQQQNLQKLTPLVERRMALMANSVAAPTTASAAPQASASGQEEGRAAADSTAILQDMRREEETLLVSRTSISQRNYAQLRLVLAAGLLASFALLGFVFRTLFFQLELRDKAERAVRKLSGHILQVQDVERRRLARDLHDSVGQLFSALLMELQVASNTASPDSAEASHLATSQELAQRGLAETRTISYLLHPPLLDEMGFEHAARWYVDGFVKRSHIDVEFKMSQPMKRLPESVELVLFRVIQESLTNVHRHSGSKRAEITVTPHPDRVSLSIRDFGRGIPEELLKGIEESSAGAGVGLGGMRERVSDLGGHFAINSASGGTTIVVSIPIPDEKSFANGDPSEPGSASVRNSNLRALSMLA